MADPRAAPRHPDAAVRWLADWLRRSAKSPYEQTLPASALPGKSWLMVRGRLETELERHIVPRQR
jgi:hypothetical protein